MRFTASCVGLVLVAGVVSAAAQEPTSAARSRSARAYQGQASTGQTERFSRRVKIGRDGRFSISNIAGEIIITGGAGDEVSIEAVKRTRGDRRELASLTIEVDTGSGRVDVRTVYPDNFRTFPRSGTGWTNQMQVDYAITVPASTEVDAKSVSGNVKVSGVQGAVRAQTVGGNVSTSATPKLELAKSVSGDIDISDIATDRSLTVGSVSGMLRGSHVKARSLDFNTVSGSMVVTDATCDRVDASSISGSLEFAGALARNGRYDFKSHSGTIRLTLPDSPGFSLTAHSFSGSIRSDLPMTLGGDADRSGSQRRRGPVRRSVQGTFGDGSATLALRTFSGDIVISKR